MRKDSELALIARLGHSAWQERKQAVSDAVMCVAAGPGNLEPLREALIAALGQGENVGLRSAALDVLGRVGAAGTSALVIAYDEVAPEARKFIVHALGEGGDPASLPSLLAALETEDANCRAAAIEALAHVGGPRAIEALVGCLSGRESFEVMAALDGLTQLGAALPYEALAPLLAGGLVRRGALPLLGRCADARAAEPLVSTLEAPSAYLAGAASRSLAELLDAGRACEEAVAEAMMSLDDAGRRGLLRLLGGDDAVTAASAARLSILAQVADAIPGVVRLAADGMLSAEALSPLQDWGRPCVELLLSHAETLPGRQAGIALELAAELCADDGPRDELRDALRRSLASGDGARMEAAARGLLRWAEASDAMRLVDAARAGGESVARACATSLAQVAELSPGAVSSALAGATLEGGFGAAMARVAVLLPPADAHALLASGLRASDAGARRASVEAFGMLNDTGRSSEISFALTDEDRAVQAAAARSMGASLASGSPDDQAELVAAALASPDAGVRAAAAAGVAIRADAAVLASLVKLVDDTNVSVAVEALLALGRLRAARLPTLAAAALAHPEAERRKAGLRSLALANSADLLRAATERLNDDAWDVRVTAAQVLAALGGAGAHAALSARLTTETDETVRATLEALVMAARADGDATP